MVQPGYRIKDMLMMWVWLAVSVSVCSAAADSYKFTVLGPGEPVPASPGASVVLPCTFSPVFSTEELEVRWHRPDGFNTPVLFYKDLKIQESAADPQYRDRVSLIGRLEEGNVSLKLENITLSDRGEYECYVSSGTWYETASVSLTMRVLGSVPVLSVTETGGEQVNVTCVSDGWSPQPTVTWRDREGRELKIKSADRFSTNAEDLVSVSSWLLFSPSESEWISCSVSLSDQEKREGRVMPVRMDTMGKRESRVTPSRIPNDNSGPWKGAFIITLVLSLLIIITLVFLFLLHRKGLIPQKKSKRNPETPEENSLLPVSPPPDRTDSENHTEKSHIQIPDWNDVMKEKIEDLTFSDKTVPPSLKVTDSNKRVSFLGPGSSTGNKKTEEFPHVWCEKNFSSGKHYWEVKVYDKELFRGHKESWCVGVARDRADREQEKPSLTPQYGYWVIYYKKDKGLYVKTDAKTEISVGKKCGNILGVFLDCDQSAVFFYNVDTKSHLYTFSNVESDIKGLVPVISPGKKEISPLMLC